MAPAIATCSDLRSAGPHPSRGASQSRPSDTCMLHASPRARRRAARREDARARCGACGPGSAAPAFVVRTCCGSMRYQGETPAILDSAGLTGRESRPSTSPQGTVTERVCRSVRGGRRAGACDVRQAWRALRHYVDTTGVLAKICRFDANFLRVHDVSEKPRDRPTLAPPALAPPRA